MDAFTLLGISLGLSMDALAVSVTNGFMIKDLRKRQAFRIAFFFGLFQAVMPVLGWAAGLGFARFIEGVDHWIAFGLLAFIGGKMLMESRLPPEACRDGEKKDCSHFPTLLLMALATSIDALAVGLSFACLKLHILMPVLVIGGVTFAVCLAGVFIGEKIGCYFENKLEFAGGIILAAIGLKILFEHLLPRSM